MSETTIWTAKHVADGPVKKWPVIQPVGRHADSIVTRLGASVFDMDEFKGLLNDIGPGNPFKAYR